MWIQRLAIVTLVIFLSSCASFPARKIPTVGALGGQPSTSYRPVVFFPIRFLTDLSGGRKPPIENAAPLPTMKKSVTALATESGMFGSITFESFEAVKADYVVQIDVTNFGNGGAAFLAGFIGGLTLGVVPIAATDNYRLEARVLNRDADVLRTYQYTDAMTTWIGIWLLPFAGNTIEKGFDAVFNNMVRTLFLDIDRDGLLVQRANVSRDHPVTVHAAR